MNIMNMPDFDEAMGFEIFSDEVQSQYDICFLVPALYRPDMERFYADPHLVGQDDIAFALKLLKSPKRTPAEIQKGYLAHLESKRPVNQQLPVQSFDQFHGMSSSILLILWSAT